MYTNIIYVILFLLLVGSWAFSEFLVQRQRSTLSGTKRDRGSMPVSLGIGLLGLVLAFALPLVWPATNMVWQPGAFFVGLGIACAGIGLRWVSILTLGQYFTGMVLIQTDHALVQHGLYKIIRHPSYTGALLLAIGIGCMIGNWISLGVVVTGLFIGLLYRIPVEELALRQVPGYEEYMQRTKRLIPFLF